MHATIMSYDKTIKFIEQEAGLSYRYILKCIQMMPDIFDPHYVRGDDNEYLFDSSALAIFQRIKQLKEQNKNLRYIKRDLVSTLPGTNQVKPVETNTIQKETGVQTQTNLISFEDWKRELQDTFREREKLKDELVELKLNFERYKGNVKLLTGGQSIEDAQRYRQRRIEIIAELKAIEGHLFKGRKRRKLLEELTALN